MKKILILLMILTLVCLAVSCGADKTPAKTTADVTENGRPLPVETSDTTEKDTVTTTAPAQNGADSTTKAPSVTETPSTTKTQNTTETPATTNPWIGMIPIL